MIIDVCIKKMHFFLDIFKEIASFFYNSKWSN